MSVLDLAINLKGFVKIPTISNSAVIDDFIFQLHYRVTSGFLLWFSVLTTGFNIVGEPMSCLLSGGKHGKTIPPDFIDAYCWIQHTFTLPDLPGGPGFGKPYPGVGPDVNLERRYHSYYQWVPLVLFLQGAMFYAPRWLWKNWENLKMQETSEGLRGIDLTDRTEKIQILIDYVRQTLQYHDTYAYCYYFCEFWNFVNVILNIFLIDAFLGGSFMTYGTDVLTFASLVPPLDRIDPMSKIFPLLTKCHFQNYGPTGNIQLYDALCLLPVNIFNEKIYIFIWFWLIALATLSATSVIFSLVTITLPSLRVAILERKLRYKLPADVAAFIREISIGDFFFLNLLSENLDCPVFRQVFKGVSSRVIQNHIKALTESPNIDVADDQPIIFPSVD